MKNAVMVTAVLVGLSAGGTAWAQTSSQLTEPQVRSLVTDWGCSNVSRLSQGKSGRWFGECQKGGQTVNVMVDDKGKVSQGTASQMTAASARADLMGHGCNNVSTLTRGPQGSYYGRCDKAGKTVDVKVDPQGKIATK